MMFTGSRALVNNLRIALCQILVTSEKVVNINRAKTAILDSVRNSAESKVDLVVLPEIWNSPYANTSFPEHAEVVPNVGEAPDAALSPSISMLCEAARAHSIWIVGGSIPERHVDEVSGQAKLYNTCAIINTSGEIVAKHRKVHLFDIDIPGRMTFKESDTLTAGNQITVVDTPWGNIGVGICYDLRFPEQAMLMRRHGCRLLVYPGAFNMVTGPAHWELLLRSRAVDNQLYMVGCSPARDTTSGGYVAWGHSTVVAPWGDVISKAGPDDETIFADLNFEEVDKMRQNIPCWSQKRADLYCLEEK